jgi:hypothetical protein
VVAAPAVFQTLGEHLEMVEYFFEKKDLLSKPTNTPLQYKFLKLIIKHKEYT